MAANANANADSDTDTQVSEDFKVEEWRAKQLERAGVPRLYARKLARGDSDLHVMLDAYAAGCTLPTLLKIFRSIDE